MADHEQVEITSRRQLRDWLEANHTQTQSVWLVTYKKSARPDLYVPWNDVVQELLCFGWIDSQGLISEAGWAAIEAAKEDGSWEFLDDVEAGIIPDDLTAVFESVPGSREQFESSPRSTTRAALEWIKQAKRPETRARRIDETVQKSAIGQRPR